MWTVTICCNSHCITMYRGAHHIMTRMSWCVSYCEVLANTQPCLRPLHGGFCARNENNRTTSRTNISGWGIHQHATLLVSLSVSSKTEHNLRLSLASFPDSSDSVSYYLCDINCLLDRQNRMVSFTDLAMCVESRAWPINLPILLLDIGHYRYISIGVYVLQYAPMLKVLFFSQFLIWILQFLLYRDLQYWLYDDNFILCVSDCMLCGSVYMVANICYLEVYNKRKCSPLTLSFYEC